MNRARYWTLYHIAWLCVLNAAPSENRWWRFTTNHRTGFTDAMHRTIACNVKVVCKHVILMTCEMLLEDRKCFFSIGISSRNSRCLCFAVFMNAQIGQMEKTKGPFSVYEKYVVRKGEKSRNWLKNSGKVAFKHASLLQVHFKYFASKDWYYTILIKSYIKTHFRLNMKKCALCSSSMPNKVQL